MVILNCAPAPPITDEQRKKIRLAIEACLDSTFVPAGAVIVRVVDVPQKRSVEATLKAVPLTDDEWRTLPVAPRITDAHPFAGALLAGVNRRRGYDWPTLQGLAED
jgi:hypothetical protein